MIQALWLTVVLGQGYFTPEEAASLFSQANEAYYREDYAASIEGYEKLLQRGFGGEDVLYNLGTAYLAKEQLGEAVLNLERARRAGGREDDIEANLAIARAKQLDQVVGGQAGDSFLTRLTLATSGRFWSALFLLTWVVGFTVLALRRFIPETKRLSAQLVAAGLLLLSLPSGLIVGAHVLEAENLHEAIVLSSTLPAKEAPKDRAKVSFEVHAGLKVRVLDAEGPFVKIRLPNGLEGWAAREGIAEI